MLQIWLIGVVVGTVVTGTIASGVYLWWPSRSSRIGRRDLGLALMTGALIAFSVLVIQLLVEFRARQADQRRQDAVEHQSLQISLGPSKLQGIDLSNADLDKFYMRHKVLIDANLAHSRLENAVLAQAILIRADLTGADLKSADLTGATLVNATLDGAHLAKAQLSDADLNGASLEGADLDGATLNDAQLRADLKRAQLDGATLDNAKLAKADLIGADLHGAWLADADLRGAILYGADLDGTAKTLPYALLDGAKYDLETTKWPDHLAPPRRGGNVLASNGWPPWMTRIYGDCRRNLCTIDEKPPAPTELKAFRLSLAKRPPLWWKIATRDPAGISLTARSGGAQFNGEVLDWDGNAKDCAKTFQGAYARGAFWHYRWLHVEIQGQAALARSYGYRDKKGLHRAIDVFFVKGGRCYRFQAVASPDVFALFKGDFETMFKDLDVKGSPLRGA